MAVEIPYVERMPRPSRAAEGGLIYHALNRANARLAIFETDEDHAAFERVLAQAVARFDLRLLGCCLMPNHFHLLLWPREDGHLSKFMRWLTVTHTQRWHAHHRTAGTGRSYQGWPIDRPRDWTARVNRPFGPREEEAVQRSIQRGQPFRSASWQAELATRLGRESVFRPRGRPRK